MIFVSEAEHHFVFTLKLCGKKQNQHWWKWNCDNICQQSNQEINEHIVINGQDAEEDEEEEDDCDYVDDGNGIFLYSRDSDVWTDWLNVPYYGGSSISDEKTGPCLRQNLPAATAAPHGSSC